jgi:hypothetical protein
MLTLQSINQYSFNWQLTNCNCRQTNAQSKLKIKINAFSFSQFLGYIRSGAVSISLRSSFCCSCLRVITVELCNQCDAKLYTDVPTAQRITIAYMSDICDISGCADTENTEFQQDTPRNMFSWQTHKH